MHGTDIKQSALAAPVASRSAKLFYYLQQSLQKFDRGMELVRSTSMCQRQAACGYECIQQLHNTFLVVARMEAIAVRDEALKLLERPPGTRDLWMWFAFLEDEFGKVDQKLHRFPELNSELAIDIQFCCSVSLECRQ